MKTVRFLSVWFMDPWSQEMINEQFPFVKGTLSNSAIEVSAVKLSNTSVSESDGTPHTTAAR